MHYSLYALLVDGVDGPGEGLHALEAVVVLHADDVVAGVAVVDGEEGHQRHPGSGVVRWTDGAENGAAKKWWMTELVQHTGYREERTLVECRDQQYQWYGYVISPIL